MAKSSLSIYNLTYPLLHPVTARYCQSFLCQLRGLMFTKELPEDQALLLVQGADSIVNASIHMMFMSIDLAVFWIDSNFTVVDKVHARKWRLAYLPRQAAKYVLEANLARLNDFSVGDKVSFDDPA